MSWYANVIMFDIIGSGNTSLVSVWHHVAAGQRRSKKQVTMEQIESHVQGDLLTAARKSVRRSADVCRRPGSAI
jgi:hypothetical protein